MAADKLIDSTKENACRTAEANAIRAKTGNTASITYDWTNSKGFADAIESIPSGGGKGGDYNIVQTIDGDNCSLAITDANTFTVIPKTVTSNGTYTAAADNADGFSQVTVAIPVYDGSVV